MPYVRYLYSYKVFAIFHFTIFTSLEWNERPIDGGKLAALALTHFEQFRVENISLASDVPEFD